MLYFFGNCQMDFLAQSLLVTGLDVEHRPLASPLTLGADKGDIPPSLAILQQHFDIERFMHGRTLKHQFQLLTPDDPPAELLVLNLFHENQPLFVQTGEDRIFFIDAAVWRELPHVEKWMRASCQQVQPNPERYLQRFTRILEALVKRCPRTPLLLVTRLLHYPAFGPAPRSYVQGWDRVQLQLPQALSEWQARFSTLHVLDMNRVLGGIWNKGRGSGLDRAEAHCPFLKLEPAPEGAGGGLSVARDLEHVGTLWPVLAARILDFLAAGHVVYAPEEQVPAEWGRPWPGPERVSEQTLAAWLGSGSNYTAARAVGAMLFDSAHDRTALLVEQAPLLPVCHNLLHMIDNYSRIQNNPLIAAWCEAHARAARRFTGNGTHYTQHYLERLERIRLRATHAVAA